MPRPQIEIDGQLYDVPKEATDAQIVQLFRENYDLPANTTDAQILEFYNAPTIGGRWKAAAKDPAQRAELAKEIGRRYAEILFPPNLSGVFEAFGKTGVDTLTFGLGRRRIQEEARKAFPGMTEDESRIVAQIAEEMQFANQPVATALGGAAGIASQFAGGGLLSKIPAVRNAVQGATQQAMQFGGALRQAPVVRNVAPRVGFTAATPTASQVASGQGVTNTQRLAAVGQNLLTGGAIGAGGGAAYEMIGAERNPFAGPEEAQSLVPSAVMGAVLPYPLAAAGAVAKRFLNPVEAAKDVLESKVGRAIQAPFQRFQQAAGGSAANQMPAGAFVPPNAAERIAPLMPDPTRGSQMSQRGVSAVDEAAKARIDAQLGPASRPSTPEQIAGEARTAANAFMNTPVGNTGITYRDVFLNTADVAPDIRRALNALGSAATRGFRNDVEKILSKPQITVGQIDGLRQAMNNVASNAPIQGAGENVRNIFLQLGVQKIDPSVPGYTQVIIDDFARTMRKSEGAALAPQAFKETPETFERTVGQNIVPGQMPERLEGLELAMAELIRRGARTPEEAIAMMRRLSNPATGANVERFGPGPALPTAAPVYVEAAENIQNIRPASLAQTSQPKAEQIGQAAAERAAYFKVNTLYDFLQRAAMPQNVRREIMDLLTNPNRTEEAIEAMMRAAGRGLIPGYTQEGLGRMLRRQGSRGVAAAQGGAMGADASSYYPDITRNQDLGAIPR